MTELSPPAAAIGRTPLGRADALVLAAAALVLLLFRLHAFPAPLESDECNYAYFAERLLAGDRLYVDLWDHQPPGIFAFLVIPTALFGSSPFVYRSLALGASLLTLALLFAVARRCFGHRPAWIAAILFALVSSDPGTGGEGCNREIYLNLLVMGALGLLVGGAVSETPAGVRNGELRRVFIASCLIGLASVIKTVVAAQWLLLLPVVILAARHGGGSRPEHRAPLLTFKTVVAFAAGPALIWLGALGYFAATGRAAEFFDAVFLHNLTYSGVGPGPIRRFVVCFSKWEVFRSSAALWIAGAIGLAALPWRRNPRVACLLAAIAAGSYLAVCLPGRFWPHYYYLMLPPIVLCSAALVARMYEQRLTAGHLAAGLLLGGSLLMQAQRYLFIAPDEIAWDRYKDRMVWGRDQAARIASVTDEDDSIYVWGADASLYYYSGRRCATRYTMYLPLIADDEAALHRRRILIEDLTRSGPRLILLPNPPCPELREFIQARRYVSMGVDHDVGRGPKRMEVLCDIERPIPRIDWTWRPRD